MRDFYVLEVTHAKLNSQTETTSKCSLEYKNSFLGAKRELKRQSNKMQLTAPYSLYTQLLVQCILAACIHAAALPAAVDIARLLQQLSERDSTQEHRSRSERAAPDHDYVQTVVARRKFWRNQGCKQQFNCGGISPQHCTNQLANVFSIDGCKSMSI